jgi:hypothetical protein
VEGIMVDGELSVEHEVWSVKEKYNGMIEYWKN